VLSFGALSPTEGQEYLQVEHDAGVSGVSVGQHELDHQQPCVRRPAQDRGEQRPDDRRPAGRAILSRAANEIARVTMPLMTTSSTATGAGAIRRYSRRTVWRRVGNLGDPSRRKLASCRHSGSSRSGQPRPTLLSGASWVVGRFQLVPFGSGQTGHDQLVGVIDQFQ
jgi:hypothetical protein